MEETFFRSFFPTGFSGASVRFACLAASTSPNGKSEAAEFIGHLLPLSLSLQSTQGKQYNHAWRARVSAFDGVAFSNPFASKKRKGLKDLNKEFPKILTPYYMFGSTSMIARFCRRSIVLMMAAR
jgi:hypothetical protein